MSNSISEYYLIMQISSELGPGECRLVKARWIILPREEGGGAVETNPEVNQPDSLK